MRALGSIRLRIFFLALLPGLVLACNNSGNSGLIDPEDELSGELEITDEELLDFTQQETFKYFWDFAENVSGAARERYIPYSPEIDAHIVTSGGSGFGLMSILTGIERNYVDRESGISRIGKIISFFESADRFHGAWPHWLDGRTGKVIPFSPKDDGGDLVETAFLAQGLITVYEYLKNGSALEQELAQRAKALWEDIDWQWYTRGENTLYWHWSPNFGFEMNMPIRGYNETLIAYVLAASSPSNSISYDVYTQGWAQNGQIKSNAAAYGLPLEVNHTGNQNLGGPLFWAHYSFLGLNPRGLSDAFVDYGKATTNHAKINYQYCAENPKNFVGYGPNCWGLTASYSRNTDGSLGYSAHSPTNDIGIVTPTAALASMPYTPVESLQALHYFYSKRSKLLGPAGFYDAFSPNDFWVAEAYLAIDQGPIVIMLENYRTGLFWRLFMQNEDIKKGLQNLNFIYES